MSVQVVTVASRAVRADEWYYRPDAFYASLERFGVTPTTLGMNDPRWIGLMSKPLLVRQWLRDGGCTADTLLFVDAWDILFAQPPDAVEEAYARKFPERPIVFNAERNCFPRQDLAARFPDPGTPFRYLNSGFIIGPTERILALLESMALDEIAGDHKDATGKWWHPNDQVWFQVAYLLGVLPMALDTHRVLCAAMAGDTIEDWEEMYPEGLPTDRTPFYVPTNSYPPVLHFNGGAKNELQPDFIRSLGLG